jgi:NAD(P)-dependent dehydrogenase (short-subunit alcohol dehydrogenase family)
MKMKRGAFIVGAGAGVAALLSMRMVARRARRIDLDGKVALITGGTRGLGLALAEELGREGCRVAICARDEDGLERARRRLEAQRIEVVAVRCDVARRDEVEEMVERVTRELGRIDIVINNAGVIEVAPLEEMTLEDFEEAMSVMYWGAVHVTLATLPAMRRRRSGSIVNITSIGGKASVPHLVPYCGAKFALVGFSEGLSAEVEGDGVRVTTVVPGLMRTGSFLAAMFKGDDVKEYGWFSVSSSLPGLTMAATRAARRIVRAVRNGEREITLTVAARMLALLHGVSPNGTMIAMRVANSLLPEAVGNRDRRYGGEIHPEIESDLWRIAVTPGVKAAKKLQEERADQLPVGQS